MPFDREWYLALKGAFAGLTESDRRAIRLVWGYPGVPVYYLPEKVGKKRAGTVWLAIGDRIAKTKLWRRMPRRIRSQNQQFGYLPFYSGVLVKLTTVVNRQQRRLVCFDLHDEAVKALQELKIISLNRRRRSTDYTRVDDLDDGAISILQNAPAEKQRILRSIIARRGQNEFRKELLQAYEGACAVTGCSEMQVLEAAHIRHFSNRGRYEIGNGLLLRADWHTLFDLEMWAIHPRTLRIELSSKISDSNYTRFAGRQIKIPRDPKCAPSRVDLKNRYRAFRKRR
jgi:hypothetical protein